MLAATYNQAAQLWKVGEAVSKVRSGWGGSLGVRAQVWGLDGSTLLWSPDHALESLFVMGGRRHCLDTQTR